MKSHNQSRDGCNQVETISYHNLSQSLPFINNPSPDLPNQINLPIPTFESIYIINLFIELATPLTCDLPFPEQMYVHKKVYSYLVRYVWFRWLTFLQIAHLSKCEIYHLRVPLSGGVDKSLTGRSSDFFLVQTPVSSFMYVGVLTKMTMASWWVDQWPFQTWQQVRWSRSNLD